MAGAPTLPFPGYEDSNGKGLLCDTYPGPAEPAWNFENKSGSVTNVKSGTPAAGFESGLKDLPDQVSEFGPNVVAFDWIILTR
jgi:hypothetical protein